MLSAWSSCRPFGKLESSIRRSSSQAYHFGGLDTATRKALARKGLPEPEGLELGIGARWGLT